MPFNELSRRDSWPPTILHIRDDEPEVSDAIDENPFSFFLTSPDDFDDDEDLSAGIESSSKDHAPVREISPSDIQRAPLLAEDDEDADFGFAMPLSLQDFSDRHKTDGRASRAGTRPDEILMGLGIAIPARAARGRATIRLTPSRLGRGRGQTRSLSARRTRLWRAPSPDLGSITEEHEGDEEELFGMEAYSASAPATSMMQQAASPTPKKRVHWAF